MDGIDLRKLAKVLALVDSAQVGEAASALQAASRILSTGGMSWGDLGKLALAGSIAPSAARKRLQRERDALQQALAEERARHALELRRLRAEFSGAQAASERTIAGLRAELAQVRRLQTPRDRRAEVIRLLRLGGLADREVARRVGVSPQTVGNIRRGLGSASG